MNKGLIAALLAALFAAVTFPVWYGLFSGGAGPAPELELPAGKDACVEDKAYMTANHMDLLNTWRDEVVRQGKRFHTSKATGEKFEMSLTNTCMSCHDDGAVFCDRCHTYANVHPTCWECHVKPKGAER